MLVSLIGFGILGVEIFPPLVEPKDITKVLPVNSILSQFIPFHILSAFVPEVLT
jgi:hypothetical protein